MNAISLLSKFLGSKVPDDVRVAIPEDGLWEPFGHIPGNYTLITYGTDALRALAERIVNGFDAINALLLKLAGHSDDDYESPIDPSAKLLPNPKDRENRLFLRVLFPFKKDFSRAVADFMDHGIGIAAAAFKSTILSLVSGNAMGLRTRHGCFGWGAASTMSYVSKKDGYTVIVSRPSPDGQIAFTVVRHRKGGGVFKLGFWEYLVDPNGEIYTADAPRFDTPSDIAIPETPETFPQGTLVRHFGYNLSSYSSSASVNEKSIYAGLQTYLFGATYPIWLQVGDHRRQRVLGLAHMLSEGGPLSIVEYRSITNRIPLKNVKTGEDYGFLGLNYYVIKPQNNGGGTSILAHKRLSVIGGHWGQAHEEISLHALSGKLFDTFRYIGSNLVVYFDISYLTDEAKAEILSSTRERLVDGEVRTLIYNTVEDAILSDGAVLAIEHDRRAESTKDSVQEDTDAVSFTDIQKFLKGNLDDLADYLDGCGGGKRPGTPEPAAAIEINPNGPTFISPRQQAESFSVYPGGKKHLHFTTDAPNDWNSPKVTIEPSRGRKTHLEVSAISELTDGHFHVTVNCPEDAPLSKTDPVVFTGNLTVSFSKKITSTLGYWVKEDVEGIKCTPKGPRFVQPEFVPINEITVDTLEDSILGLQGLTTEEATATFAYHIEPGEEGKSTVYYSTVFPVYRQVVGKADAADKARLLPSYKGALQLQAMLLGNAPKSRYLCTGNEEDQRTYSASVRASNARFAVSMLYQAKLEQTHRTEEFVPEVAKDVQPVAEKAHASVLQWPNSVVEEARAHRTYQRGQNPSEIALINEAIQALGVARRRVTFKAIEEISGVDYQRLTRVYRDLVRPEQELESAS